MPLWVCISASNEKVQMTDEKGDEFKPRSLSTWKFFVFPPPKKRFSSSSPLASQNSWDSSLLSSVPENCAASFSDTTRGLWCSFRRDRRSEPRRLLFECADGDSASRGAPSCRTFSRRWWGTAKYKRKVIRMSQLSKNYILILTWGSFLLVFGKCIRWGKTIGWLSKCGTRFVSIAILLSEMVVAAWRRENKWIGAFDDMLRGFPTWIEYTAES